MEKGQKSAVAAIDDRERATVLSALGEWPRRRGLSGCRLEWGALSGQDLARLRGACPSAVRLVCADRT